MAQIVDQEFALNDGHGQVQFEQQQGPEADYQPTGPGRHEERDEHNSTRVGTGLEDSASTVPRRVCCGIKNPARNSKVSAIQVKGAGRRCGVDVMASG